MKNIYKYEFENGEVVKGFCNGKNYNGTIYINPINDDLEIDYKTSIKIENYDKNKLFFLSVTTKKYNEKINTVNTSKPHTVHSWMREMERIEKNN